MRDAILREVTALVVWVAHHGHVGQLDIFGRPRDEARVVMGRDQ
jgi:hypothetical protein